jgi:uncharacterized protein YjdB
MNKKLLCKCLITLGILLSFTLLTPLASYNVAMAQVIAIDKEKPLDYRLNLKSVTIVKGKTFTLKAYNLSETTKISFKSDDVEIASVSEDGTITANKVGTTIITVTIKDGTNNPPSLTCDITVGPPAFSIKLTRSRIILGIENSDTLKVILKPSNSAEDARFSSYDPNIVSISTGGRATAKKLGMTYLFAEIDATNNDGTRKFAVCSAIVVDSEDVPLLETYFNEHSELYYISEADLIKSLDDFFNGKTNGDSTSTKLEEVSKSTLVNNLNRYLEDKFDLTGLRAKAAAATLLNAASNIK